MRTFLKNAAKHTAIFGLGDLLNRLVGILLLPIYLNYLSPADYGLLELLGILSLLLGMIILQGIPTASFKGVSQTYIGQKEEQKKVIGTAYIYLFITALLFFGCCYLMSEKISELLFSDGDYSKLVRIVFVTGFLTTVNNMPGIIFRAYLRSLTAVIVSLSTFLINCVLKIYFVVFMNMGVEGILWGGLITAALFFIITPVLIRKDISWSFSIEKLKTMIIYGWPLIPGGIAAWILNGADRYCLEHFSTRSELGIYSLGFQIAVAINFLFLGPFQKIWPALFFPIADEPDAPKTLGRFSTYFFCFGYSLSIMLVCGAKPLLMLIAPEGYLSAYLVVPILVIGLLLNGFQQLLNVGIYVRDKTKYAPVILVTGAVINIVLNMALIPHFGMIGAAFATLFSSFTMVILTHNLNKKFYHVDYEFSRIFNLTCIFIIFAVIDLLVPYSAILNMLNMDFKYTELAINTCIKAIVIFGFLMTIYLSNIFNASEKMEINMILSKVPIFGKLFQEA